MSVLRNGLAGHVQNLPEDLSNFPGTVTTAASVGPFTTTEDLREHAAVGDYVIFSGHAGVLYGLAAMTSTTITLANSYAGTTGAGQTMWKASINYPDATPTPAQSAGAGTGGATLGSTAVTGSGTSYNTVFVAGDAAHFGADTKVYVIRAVTSATAMVLETNYEGTTGTGKAYRKSNWTPIRLDSPTFGRWGAVWLGTSSTAATTSDTGPGAEITTGGGGRRSGTNVTTSLTTADSGASWAANWATSFQFTATFGLFELGIANNPVANRGINLIRQVFAAVFNVVSTNVLNVVVSDTASAAATATGVVPSIALKEFQKLSMSTDTSLGVGNSWDTNQGTRFDTIAVGTASTAPALSQVALGAEISSNGFARHTGDAAPRVYGTIMRDPDVANTYPYNYTADSFTSFKGDTVQLRTDFAVTGTQTTRERGWFNGSVAGDGDPAAGSRMGLRQVDASDINWVNTDIDSVILRVQAT